MPRVLKGCLEPEMSVSLVCAPETLTTTAKTMSALQVVRGFFQVNFFTVTESIEKLGIFIAAADTME
jgi:hypothetical protein